MGESMKDLLETLKFTKDADKHLLIIEELINNDILFVESSELIYDLWDHHHNKVLWFVRTNMIQYKQNGKLKTGKLKSFEELVNFLQTNTAISF